MNRIVRLLAPALAAALLVLAPPAWADGRAKVSIDAQEQDVRDVLRALAQAAKVELKLRPEVRGVVTTSITDTPFEQALTVVAATLDLRWRLIDGVYHVGRFSTTSGQTGQTTERIPVQHQDATVLARAFGYLDLGSLDQPAAGLDLRALLPPGLMGPPVPLAAGNLLEVTGTPAAVSDFKYLVEQLDRGAATLQYDVLIARITPEACARLQVYWAKGGMNFGRSSGREALYTVGDFTALADRLAQGTAGVEPIGRPTVTSFALSPAAVKVGTDGDGGVDVRLVGRLEAGLQLRLWLRATVHQQGWEPVELVIDGGPLPPEEGALLISKPLAGTGTGPILVLVQPKVSVGDDAGE
jgi:hypothetical protein